MNKRLFVVLLSIIVIIAINFCVAVYVKNRNNGEKKDMSNFYLKRAKEITNFNLDDGDIKRFTDTKGGFFGEGDALLELQYPYDKFQTFIENASTDNNWKELPVNKELQKYLMGLSFECPANGYYLFYDRHREAESHYDYKEMMKRHSRDFTVIFLDENTKRVTIIERDT